MEKIKIQLVGKFYAPSLTNYFPQNIYIQNVLCNISPFSTVGTVDRGMLQEWESKLNDFNTWETKPESQLYERQRTALFDLKKNFNQFLSRDPESFCDNVTFTQLGKEVLTKNNAQYIIVDNTGVALPLINYNNVLYSECWPSSPFAKWIKQQNGCFSFNPATAKEFNWRFYYDQFIDEILTQYDCDHIILIKTQCSNYYFENNDLKLFPKLNPAAATFIEQIDNYFAMRTGCYIIYDLLGKIPNKNFACTWSYGVELGNWQSAVVSKIMDITEDKSDSTACRFKKEYQHFSSLAKILRNKLREDKLPHYDEFLNNVEQKRISDFDQLEARDIECPDDILILKELISKNKSLSEYMCEWVSK